MNVNLYVQSSIQNYSLAAVSSARCEQNGREASPAGKQDSVEIYSLTYVEFLLRQYQCAENTIKEYYAEAHRNNLSWGSIADGMNYISMKYTELGRLMGSSYYRADMSEAERKMALHQERIYGKTGSQSRESPDFPIFRGERTRTVMAMVLRGNSDSF